MSKLGPKWWNDHGMKMSVEKFDNHHKMLIISSKAAKLTITRHSIKIDEGWYVDWEIVNSQREKVTGRIVFSTYDLISAFGLSDNVSLSDNENIYYEKSLIETYGAEAARQGKYIRDKEYLNIPCPGTGHGCDPNLSLKIDERMQDCLCQLLQQDI